MHGYIFQWAVGIIAIVLTYQWCEGAEKITQEQAIRRLMWGRE